MNTVEAGERVIEAIFNELRAAEKKHPGWPTDKIHAVAIMVEEAGEAMQAAIDHVYSKGDIAHLDKELAQTGAMAIRAMINLRIEERCWLCGSQNPDTAIKVGCETPGGKPCAEKTVMVHGICYLDMDA